MSHYSAHLFSIARIGETITFSLSIEREDNTHPDYDITLSVVISLPVEDIINVIFDPAMVISNISFPGGINATLALDQLSYSMNFPRLIFGFDGIVGELGGIKQPVRLSGYIEYQSDPSNGHMYSEFIAFPDLYIRDLDFNFSLLSTSLDLTDGPLVVVNEVSVCRAQFRNIVGPSANLNLLVELNDVHMNITDAEIVHIG